MKSARQINLENAEYYGFDVQKDQLFEECGELIQAINKYSRAQGKGKPINIGTAEAVLDVIEEIADVEVMLEQMVHLLGIRRVDIETVKMQKIVRTETDIEKEKEKKKHE